MNLSQSSLADAVYSNGQIYYAIADSGPSFFGAIQPGVDSGWEIYWTPFSGTLLSGSGSPSSSTGLPGDFYIDTKTLMFYGPKKNGLWPIGISMKGDPGKDGIDGKNGIDGLIKALADRNKRLAASPPKQSKS